jgi:hypothetical protein
VKRLLIVLLLFAACASRAAAQSPAQSQPAARPAQATAPDALFHLGERDVLIPAPEGFVEATSRSERVKMAFEATEGEGLDLLAVHLPADVLRRMERGENPEPDFYTKVSVSKRLRVINSSQQDLASLAAYMRANSSKVFDFNSPALQEQLKRQNKGLSELLKQDAAIDFSKPVNLGEIASTPDSFGTLLLVKTKFKSGEVEKEKMLLSGICFVRVRDRIIFIYTYHVFNSEGDADVLREFSKRWMADILRANAR